MRKRDYLTRTVAGKPYVLAGGVADKETQLPTYFSDSGLHGILADPSQAIRGGEYRIYDNISPTIAARDYKEPRLVIVEREDGNE